MHSSKNYQKSSSIHVGFCPGNKVLFTDEAPNAELSLRTEDLWPLNFKTVNFESQAKLVSGIHALELQDRAVKIEIEPSTNCVFEFCAKTRESNGLFIDFLKLEFLKPLKFINIFTTLDETWAFINSCIKKNDHDDDENELSIGRNLNQIVNKAGNFLEKQAENIKNFESVKRAGDFFEKNATPYLDRIAESKGWKNLVAAAEKTSEKAAELSPVAIEKSLSFLTMMRERGEAVFDRAIEGVSVSRLEIRTKNDKSGLRLAFYLSGEIVIHEKVRIPMDQMELPSFLFTRLDAQLQNLVAQFCMTSDKGASISKTLLGAVDGVHGQLKADLDITPFLIDLMARGGRQCSLDVQSHRSCQCHCSVDVKHEREKVYLEIEGKIGNHDEQTFACHVDLKTSEDALIACGEKLNESPWSFSLLGHGNDITGYLVIDETSMIFPESVELVTHDPALKNDLKIPIETSSMPISGGMEFGISAQNATIYLHMLDMKVQGTASWDLDQPLELGPLHTRFSECRGQIDLSLKKQTDAGITLDLAIRGNADLTQTFAIPELPELHLLSHFGTSHMTGAIDAQFHGEISTAGALEASFAGSTIHAEIEHFSVICDEISMQSEDKSTFDLTIHQAKLNDDGLSDSVVSIGWNLTKIPELCCHERRCPVFEETLQKGHLQMRTSEQGYIHFEHGSGFFDEHFFNMLLYPEHEKQKLSAIFQYRPLLEKLEEIADVMRDIIGSWPLQLASRIRSWWKRCEQAQISVDLNHVVHRRDFARMVTLFLFENEEHLEEIDRIFEQSMHCIGFDRFRAEALLVEAFPELDFPQLGNILKIADRIVRGFDFEQPEIRNDEALCDEYSHEFRLLPSANQLFDLDDLSTEDFKKLYKYGGPCLIDTPTTRRRIYKYAAGYTISQLEWLLEHHGHDFSEIERLRIQKLIGIKKRIQKQEPREGSFIVQDFNIDYFLQPLLDMEKEMLPDISNLEGCLDDLTERCQCHDVENCFATWLVPEDVGRLLCAGISSRLQSQIVQCNQKRLLDYLVSRGRVFAMASIYEMASGSDRVLTTLLMSFLAQDQSLLREPVDRVQVLSELLGIEIPRRREYLNGGIHAAESYYEKLYQVAHTINRSVTPYEAAKLRMQSDRIATESPILEETPKRPPHVDRYPEEDELFELNRAIEKADALGRPLVASILSGNHPNESETSRVQKAYRYAYRLASAIFKSYPDVFEKEIFKKFYARTYEALMIQTLDRNLVEDVDQVRTWFEVRTHIAAHEVVHIDPATRRNLVIDVLYFHPEDRETRRADPLTWVELRPEKRTLDLTILFAPGVITEGVCGREIHTAFDRLEKRYGVKVVRADTGNIKSLNYNARIIQEAIKRITTPYLLMGYSQGCANMMCAEAGLYGGTPAERSLLDRLVARHFICSALNGSPHAVCGGECYYHALVNGEKCLKSLSAVTSSAMNHILFEVLRKFLDSPFITTSLSSLESLSYQGLTRISRDLQYQPGVLSTEFQGAIQTYIPENLEYLAYHFNSQAPGILNDTQVGADCAHGYFVYNRNASVDLLRRESIPIATLQAHHWNPLYDEVAFIESPQDVRHAVYRTPKDIHVFPAIETLMMFGKV